MPSITIGLEIISSKLATLPKSPGVYRMIDASARILYIGKAKDLSKRVASYLQIHKLPVRLQNMVNSTADMEFITTNTEVEALLLEASLIRNLQPKYNILLRDDKSFPYILIRDDHPFAQLNKFRGSLKKTGKFFGPFASTADVDETIKQLQRIFQLRTCSDNYFAKRARPCLLYQIKKCSAPCVAKISQHDYQGQVQNAIDFLTGKSKQLQQKLAGEMEQASESLEYERAAILRDRIKALTTIQTKQTDLNLGNINADIIGLYQLDNNCCIQVFFIRAGQNYGNQAYFPIQTDESDENEILSAFLLQFYQSSPVPSEVVLSHNIIDKKTIEQALSNLSKHKVHIKYKTAKYPIMALATRNALESLERQMAERSTKAAIFAEIKKLFGLSTLDRIEIYDNSHISGKHAVGAMVVADFDGFRKHSYRSFTIKTDIIVTGGDDYQMLHEALTRRLKRLLKTTPQYEAGIWPDLILIDGGKGHLTTASEVLQKLHITNIKLVAIAKGPDRNAGREYFYASGQKPFTLNKDLQVMRYLQILRDEAHRFAITTHRKKRAKDMSHSSIDDLDGIGPKRKKALLHHFGSFAAVKEANLETLAAVSGISKKLAKVIWEQLKLKQ
jgi:excinuclease ABC subunit C